MNKEIIKEKYNTHLIIAGFIEDKKYYSRGKDIDAACGQLANK